MFAAFMNFTGDYLLGRDDAETARADAAKHLTYKGSTWTDHLSAVTVIEIDDATFKHLCRGGRSPLLSKMRKRFRVVEPA